MAARISLARGVPSSDLLSVAAIADAARDAVLAAPDLALGYGDPAGHPALRAWFGELLGVEAERVLVTNGSLQALAFLAPELAGPGDWIAVEEPTYDFSLRQLAATGGRLVGLPVQPDGLDVAALEREIAAAGPPAFCYTIPTFQNPTGRSLATAKRRALVALAAAHQFRVVEDDPYRLLGFEGEPSPTLLSLDPQRVIHLTSLTKTAAPGLRCGAVVLPPGLLERIADVAQRTYIAPGHLAQATAARFVRTTAFDAGLAHAVAELRVRRDRLLAGLARLGLACDTPAGGYFAWPHTGDADAVAVAEAARRHALDVVPGTQFFPGPGGEHRLRLTWAAAAPAEIDAAIERLGRALDETGVVLSPTR
jgi:DNA-binding transcriptional MocR family regulator